MQSLYGEKLLFGLAKSKILIMPKAKILSTDEVNSKQENYDFKFFCVQILKLFITPKIILLNFLN